MSTEGEGTASRNSSDKVKARAKKKRINGTGRSGVNAHDIDVPQYIDATAFTGVLAQYAQDRSRNTLGVLVSKYFSPLAESVVRVWCYSLKPEQQIDYMLEAISACVRHSRSFKPSVKEPRISFTYFTEVVIEALDKKRQSEKITVVQEAAVVHEAATSGGEDCEWFSERLNAARDAANISISASSQADTSQ